MTSLQDPALQAQLSKARTDASPMLYLRKELFSVIFAWGFAWSPVVANPMCFGATNKVA